MAREAANPGKRQVAKVSPPGPAELSRKDGAAALLLALGLFALYAAFRQDRLWNDAFVILDICAWPEHPWYFTWNHFLYLPLVRFLAWVSPLGHTFADAALASSLPAAAAAGVVVLAARAAGASLGGAVIAALLVSLAPATAVFATLIELHAVHFLGVAIAVLFLVRSAGRVSARAFEWRAVLWFAPIALTHLSAPTLGPGWLALGTWLAWRHYGEHARGRRFWGFALRIAGGTALVFGVVLGLLNFTLFREADTGSVAHALWVIENHGAGFSWDYFLGDWVLPLGPVWLLLIALGLLSVLRPLRARLRPDTAALVAIAWIGLVLPFLFFSAWGVDNQGGYLAGSLPLLALALARASDLWPQKPRVGEFVALALVVFTAALAHLSVTGWSTPELEARVAARTAAVRAALPEGGVLIGFHIDEEHPADVYLASVRELNLLQRLQMHVAAGEAPELIAARLDDQLLRRVVPFDGPVAIEPTFLVLPLEPGPAKEIADAFRARLLEHFEMVPLDGVEPPMARLVARR